MLFSLFSHSRDSLGFFLGEKQTLFVMAVQQAVSRDFKRKSLILIGRKVGFLQVLLPVFPLYLWGAPSSRSNNYLLLAWQDFLEVLHTNVLFIVWIMTGYLGKFTEYIKQVVITIYYYISSNVIQPKDSLFDRSTPPHILMTFSSIKILLGAS